MRQHASQKQSRPLDKQGAESQREDTVREMRGESHSCQGLQSSVLYMLETTPQLYQCLHSCNFPTAMLLQQWYNQNNNRMSLPSTLFLSFFSSVFFTEVNACPAVEEVEFRRHVVVASSAEHGCSEVIMWVCVCAVGECRRIPSGQGSRWGQVKMKPGWWGDCLHEANDWANE